jgi:Protein of unknown function (DUF2752)
MENFFSGQLLPCAYRSLFGVDCPICGFQRAFLLLVKGDIMESLKMYAPLIPILILITIGLMQKVKPNWIGKRFLTYYSLVVLIVIMVNYTIKLML